LFEHLQQPTPEQATWLEALLAEDAQQIAPDQKTVRLQAIAMLAQMFTEDDWQALAKSGRRDCEGYFAGLATRSYSACRSVQESEDLDRKL
jgi:hypothetical protein